ncbi:MAG: class A beta-lactamase [Hyphomonadaceae bacterium]|nr:class A beta-lactamase [Hyphomonadaceae bacterium]
MTTRRELIAGGVALAATGCASYEAPPASHGGRKIAEIEKRIGGRIGVFAINTETLSSLAHRHGERFAMASTFKWLLAAAILKQAEAGTLKLDHHLSYTSADILPNSPITEAHLAEGSMTIEALCEAIVTVSDNCGANLLLAQIGGPAGLTKFLRDTGDRETRLDRRELDLNENRRDDPRDTTTPMAMALTAERLLVRGGLSKPSQEKLHAWLIATRTGLDRLRAGLPGNWLAGDKTGTGGNGSHNDVAIAWPPGKRPILIACYMSESPAPNADKAVAHADIARIIADEWY